MNLKNLLATVSLFIFICISSTLLARSSFNNSSKISGVILDATTKEPLPNASIVLFEKTTHKLTKVELSDLEGKFLFSDIPTNIYTLHVQYIGYQEWIMDSLIVNSSIELTPIHLTRIDHQLKGVNVIAVKPLIEQKATGITVNVAESSLATGGSVYDILQKTPGLNVKDDAITLRGKSLSVLLNGRLVNLPAEEIMDFIKSMPASSVEKIELVSNLTGKYDGQVQAILNIKTLKAKHDYWGGIITMGAGAGRKWRSNGSTNIFYKKNKLSFSGSWDYLGTPSIWYINRWFYLQSTRLDEKRIRTINQYSNTFKLDVDYALNSTHAVGFSFRPTLTLQHYYNPVYTTIQDKNSAQIDSVLDFNTIGHSSFKNMGTNLYYKTTFDTTKNKELIINVDYYRHDRSSKMNYSTQTLQYDLIPLNHTILQLNDTPLQISIRSLSADYTHTTSLASYQAGFKTSWTSIDNSSIWKKYDENQWLVDSSTTDHFLYAEYIQGAYAGIDKTFRKININISLRAEHTLAKGNSVILKGNVVNRDYINIFPSVTIKYNPSSNHEWIAAYRKSIKRPSYQNLNPFLRMASPNSYTAPSAYLLPELINDYTITYGFHESLFLTLNYQQRNRMITEIWRQMKVNSNIVLVSSVENYRVQHTWGADIAANRSLFSWWTINVNCGVEYYQIIHPDIPTAAASPILSVGFSSAITLPRYWNMEFSGLGNNGFSDGFDYSGHSYSLNFSLKKAFFEKRLTISALVSGYFPYWVKEQSLFLTYNSSVNRDLRYFICTIQYQVGSNKKSASSNRKSTIDAEKNRTN